MQSIGYFETLAEAGKLKKLLVDWFGDVWTIEKIDDELFSITSDLKGDKRTKADYFAIGYMSKKD